MKRLITAGAFIALASATFTASSASAAAQGDYCRFLTVFADAANRDRRIIDTDGVLLKDGASSDCAAMRADIYFKFLIRSDGLPPEWRGLLQVDLNNDTCGIDETMRQAILSGWTVAAHYAFPDGEQFIAQAQCQ